MPIIFFNFVCQTWSVLLDGDNGVAGGAVEGVGEVGVPDVGAVLGGGAGLHQEDAAHAEAGGAGAEDGAALALALFVGVAGAVAGAAARRHA